MGGKSSKSSSKKKNKGESSTSSLRRQYASEHSLLKSSEEYVEIDYSCDTCKLIYGKEKEAKGYCNDCKKYLCRICVSMHRLSSLSKDHVWLDQGSMPKKSDRSRSEQPLDAPTDRIQQRKKELVFHNTINVGTGTDETDCLVERMTLVTKNELAIIDYNNKTLKIVDITLAYYNFSKITGTLKFKSAPEGMTKISDKRIAVTLPSECKVEIISTSERISVENTLKTSGQCLGICFKNEKLYVSFKEKLQILRMTGAVQRTIHPCGDALKHYKQPSGLAVSPDEKSIYVSDLKSHKLMGIDLDGTLLFIYQDELDSPRDILISPSGSVYLFVANYHCLYEMKSDLSEATVILGQGDGLTFPNSLCFEEFEQKLYVSTASTDGKLNNDIKMYERKYV